MSYQTKFNMSVGSMIKTLEKSGIVVADEKNKAGNYDITLDGKLIGEISHLQDGTPFIRSFTVTENVSGFVWDAEKNKTVKNTTAIPKHYMSASAFIRFGIRG